MISSFNLTLLLCLLLFSGESNSAFKQVGGCLIHEVYKRNDSPNELKKYCVNRVNTLITPEITFLKNMDKNALTSELDTAYRAAEKRISGSIYGVSKGRNVIIIIDPGNFINAGVSETKDTVYIVLNAGIINMAASSVNAVYFDMAFTVNPNLKGLTFTQWIETFRNAAYQRNPYVPPPGVDDPNFNWYVETLNPRMTLYHFIFAHELAHIHAGKYCGLSKPLTLIDRVNVELACDQIAIKSFKKQYREELALFLPPFQLAHASYLSLFADDMLLKMNIPLPEHRETLLLSELTESIPPRLEGNMSFLLPWATENSESHQALSQWYKTIRKQYLPVLRRHAIHESRESLVLNRHNIQYRNGKCKLGYSIINKHKDETIKSIIELKSYIVSTRDDPSLFSRKAPKTDIGVPYFLLDATQHKLNLSPGQEKNIYSNLVCVKNAELTTEFSARVMSSKWSSSH